MRNNRWNCVVTGRAALLALAAALALAACAGRAAVKPAAPKPAAAKVSVLRPSSWHLPWRKAPPAAPVAVNELPVQTESSAPLTVLQYWSRNTLRVDLGVLSGTGSVKLLPSPVNGWPARLEFAVGPGSIAQLDVQGDQRVVFAVPASTPDGGPQVLPLSPTAYSASTAAIVVTWN